MNIKHIDKTHLKMKAKFTLQVLLILILLFTVCLQAQSLTKFAVIGDYGSDGSDELAVANLVKSWNPEFIITVGDNNYSNGSASTIDKNIGKYYQEFIKPYNGSYGSGSPDINRFYPVPGNHDWNATNLQPYIDYFELPNNERYYEFTWGNIQFFMIDADGNEPDGYSASSDQAMWIKDKMENSTARWKIAALHYSPYSSADTHGSISTVQWPYKEWGADAVFSGHDHTYERLSENGLTYFVDGLGGRSLRTDDFSSDSTKWVPGSQVRYAAEYGAMLINVYSDSMNCKFINVNGDVIDNFTISKSVSGIKNENSAYVKDFQLSQNYPNPFNPTTKISWQIPANAHVTLKLYNVIGKEVATLIDEEEAAGLHDLTFDADQYHLSSGIYFYKISTGSSVEIKKMVLLK